MISIEDIAQYQGHLSIGQQGSRKEHLLRLYNNIDNGYHRRISSILSY